jgi:hypothetical protein
MASRSPGSVRNAGGLIHLIRARREPIAGTTAGIRLVHRSEVIRVGQDFSLERYISDRAPLFYRSLDGVVADLRAGLFMSALQSTLARLPTSQSFRESHFGEIVAGVFAEDVMGLRRLYSKLTLLTAENANAYKMDLVLYDPAADPINFVFGEVKCSPKCAADGLPAGHDGSCFADVFNSMNKYSESDKQFDLTAARDHLASVPEGDRERLRSALKPYSDSTVRYAAFAVIDTSTYSQDEAQVLRNRANAKPFEVDLICLEAFVPVADAVFSTLAAHLSIRTA